MTGDERARFCGQCQKHVYNLSAMTRAQIEALVRETEGRFCGRFYRRADGRMLTADCPTGQRRRRDRLACWGGAVFAAVMVLFGIRATSRAQEKNKPGAPEGEPTRLMGEVSVASACKGSVTLPQAVVTNRTPIIMGKIALPQPAGTNKVGALTNGPTPDSGRVILGQVAVPARTNRTSPPATLK